MRYGFRPPPDDEPPPKLIREAIRATEQYPDNPDMLPMVKRRIGSKETHHRQGRENWVRTTQRELYHMDALTLVVGTPETELRERFRGRTVEHIAGLSRNGNALIVVTPSVPSKNNNPKSIKRTVERQLQISTLAGLLESKRITDTTPDGRKVGRASIRWFPEQLFVLLGLDKHLKAFRKFVSDSLKAVRATARGKAIASLSLKVARSQLGDNKPHKTIGEILKRGPP